MMFQDEYKSAYNQIRADEDQVNKILEGVQKEKGCKNKVPKFRPVAVAMLLVVTLLVGVTGSVLVKEDSVFSAKEVIASIKDYDVFLQRYCPIWKGGFIPDNATDTESGVVMTVEAAAVDDEEFTAVISFANEEDGELFIGEKEYHLYDMSAKRGETDLECENIEFLKYDEEKEKLYFLYKGDRGTAKDAVGEEVSLSVRGIFTSETWMEEFDLTNIETAPDTRMAKGLIISSSNPVVKLENDEYPYEARVLNMTPLSEIKTDAVEVTGIAYMDGILRIQVCHGDSGRLNNVWRRGYVYRYNEDKEEVLPEKDGYMYWYERVNGKVVEFVEYYYVMSEEEARELPLLIECIEAKGYFNTVWKVDFEVE